MQNEAVHVTIDAVADGRHGVFCGRQRICGLGETIPPEFHGRQVKVCFASGLMLDCLGRDVLELARGRW